MITLKKLCSTEFQNSQISAHQEELKNFFSDLRNDLKDGFSSPFFSELFLNHLGRILKELENPILGTHVFHFSQLLEQIIDLNLLLEDEEDESIIVNYLRDCFFSDLYGQIEKDSTLDDITKKIISLLEDQIISYFYLHVGNKKITFNEPVLYHMQPTLGDSNKAFHIGDNLDEVLINSTPETFPFIAIKSIDKKIGLIEIESSSDLFELPIRKNENRLNLNGKKVPFLGDDSFINDMHLDKLEDLLPIVTNFTKKILFDTGDTDLANWGTSSLHPKHFTIEHELIINASIHYFITLDQSLTLLNDDLHEYQSPWSDEKQTASEIYAHVFNSTFLYMHTKDEALKEKILASGPILQDAFNYGEIGPTGNEVIEALFEQF